MDKEKDQKADNEREHGRDQDKTVAQNLDLLFVHQVSQFLYMEARLQDDHAYAEWESLWTDDGIYWIPANGEGEDPENQMSILYDNRSRISIRVKQLLTGKRLSQSPKSRLRRIVSNIEILDVTAQSVSVTSNAFVFESSLRGDTLWASKNEFILKRENGSTSQPEHFKMAYKKVVLVNNHNALYSMAFLM
jgi:3-phenylpropionate/cinnamic acid dioxygenase small subunit